MFNNRRKIALWVLALWLWAPSLVCADQIYFNNGRKMEGRIISDEDGKLEIAFPTGVTMTIDKEGIKRIKKSDPSEIQINFVEGHNSMLADCVINENTTAVLLIDTGASVCMLSKKLGDSLGIDTTDPKFQTKVQVADGRSVPAFYTKLKSLRLQHVEAKDVEAVILLEDLPMDVSYKDGLLGMSFLGRYSTRIDYSRKKFIIEA